MKRITNFDITDEEDRLSVTSRRGGSETMKQYSPTDASAKRLQEYCSRHHVKVIFETYGDGEQYMWIVLKG